MIVLPDKKAVLLKLRNPEAVMGVIPKACSVTYEGKNYIAVPHQAEVVKVLRNIGINAPAPVSFYYDWPGRFKPFEHQKHITEFLTLHNRAFNLADLGLGKTLATLWAYDYLRSRGVAHKALVISPLSTLERTWGDEIFSHFPHLTFAVVHGTKERRLQLLNQDVDIYLINHDGIKVSGVVEALSKRKDIDLIILDEIAQVARHSGSDRFKALNTIINRQVPRMAWGITGAPIPNSPVDAWAQCRLLVPERVPQYFNRFRDMVMRQVSQFTWVPKDNALDIVYSVMQPAIRFHRDDCLDLPPCMYETRQVFLSATQKKAYTEMLNQLYTEIGSGQVTAVNEAVKAQKLIQIASGMAYGTDGSRIQIDARPRMEVVVETIEQSASKVIVFVPFVGAIGPLQQFIESRGYSCGVIHGGISKNERDKTFTDFQKGDDPRVLVAQPAAMSHGLTLTAASTIVWFAPIPDNDVFEQANARITRPGQRHSQLIVLIEGTAIERKYYQRLRNKQRVQGALLDMMKEDVT